MHSDGEPQRTTPALPCSRLGMQNSRPCRRWSRLHTFGVWRASQLGRWEQGKCKTIRLRFKARDRKGLRPGDWDSRQSGHLRSVGATESLPAQTPPIRTNRIAWISQIRSKDFTLGPDPSFPLSYVTTYMAWKWRQTKGIGSRFEVAQFLNLGPIASS